MAETTIEDLEEAILAFKRSHIIDVLSRSASIREGARRLGIHPMALYRLTKRHQIQIHLYIRLNRSV